MSANYGKPLPVDRDGGKMVMSPPSASSLGSKMRENAATSSVMAFNDNTTVIEVTALGTAAGLKWATNQATSVYTSILSENYDNIIPPNSTRIFVVPRLTQAVNSIVGLNIQEGLFPAVALRSVGIGSVLVAQY